MIKKYNLIFSILIKNYLNQILLLINNNLNKNIKFY